MLFMNYVVVYFLQVLMWLNPSVKVYDYDGNQAPEIALKTSALDSFSTVTHIVSHKNTIVN